MAASSTSSAVAFRTRARLTALLALFAGSVASCFTAALMSDGRAVISLVKFEGFTESLDPMPASHVT